MVSFSLGLKVGTTIPMTEGARPLIWIPSAWRGLPRDLTAPTMACFDVAYIGAIGKG
jgi:hypothetical protein